MSVSLRGVLLMGYSAGDYLLCPREVGCPVCLPRLVVEGERLLPTGVVAIFLDPGVTHLDGPPVLNILAVKFAMSTIKATDERRFQLSALGIDPIQRPLLLLQIERLQK
jgi:hypothetical protein